MTSFQLNLIVCGISFVGFILIIIGVATPEWAENELVVQEVKIKVSYGLWKGCQGSTCIEYSDIKKDTLADKIKACDAFGILSILAGVASFGALASFTALGHLNKTPSRLILNIARVAGVVTASFVIITTAIWGNVFNTYLFAFNLGYSFALTLVGGGLSLIAIIISFFTQRT